ncbi:MAG: TolC family protein [Armatimonadota bacterium]|jgi:cobalt-zinc-cadmium efflux system outer membrane protein
MTAIRSRRAWLRAFGLFALLTLLAGPSAVRALADGTAPAGALDRLIEVAVSDNPDLAAVRGRIEATEARVPQAGSLPDPEAMVALSNVPVGSTALDRTPMTGIQLGLRQMVPYPGRLDLRELAARQDVAITRAIYEESENAVIRDVKRAWNELFYLHRAVEVTRLNRQIAQALTEVADALYSTGFRPQQDLVKANVEVARLVERLVVLEERISRAEARLNGLLDRPADAPLPAPDVAFEPLTLSAEALEGAARESRPLLLETAERVERAETMMRLARMNMKPDFHLGVDYRIRSSSPMDAVGGRDFWTLSVGANLPWLNRDLHEAEVDEQQALLDAAREQDRAAFNRVREALDNALEAARTGRRQASLYAEGLIPQAELGFSAARAAYETGRVDLIAVLDAFRTLNGYQEQYYRIVADHANAIADLEYVIGQRLR